MFIRLPGLISVLDVLRLLLLGSAKKEGDKQVCLLGLFALLLPLPSPTEAGEVRSSALLMMACVDYLMFQYLKNVCVKMASLYC